MKTWVLEFENLVIIDQQDDTPKRVLTTDEMSCKTFDMATVKGRQTQSSLTQPSDQDSVAATSDASGGGGLED